MIVWPGLRRSVSAISRLFNSASFVAPLTHSAIPTRAASGTTATFTRATTKTWTNNDGYLVTGVAGEIGFVGARRVRNRLTFTEDVTNPAWSLGGLTAPSADSIKETAVSIAHSLYRTDVTGTATWQLQAEVKPDGRDWVAVWFFAAGTVKGILANVATGAFVSNLDGANLVSSYDITATDNGYYRVSIVGTLALVQCGFSASDSATPTLTATKLPTYLGDITKGLFVRKFQLEDITGRADQTTPSEYVSVGVESAPLYHGSFVDGVKCFPTDISGNPIPLTTLLGYSAEGARTNLCLQSNAFTTTWTDGGTLTATQNATGPDGTTSAWTITDTDAAVASYKSQGITLTAAAYTFSVYVKKTTGIRATYPVIFFYTGTTIALATIDTSNGVVTPWTAYTGFTMLGGISARITSYNADFWRVELTATATAALYIFRLLPAATTNATQSTGVQDGTLQGSAVFYGAQLELGSFASSYIPTTTVAVARNADVLTYSSAGNIDGTKGWCYAEVQRQSLDTSGGVYPTAIDIGTNRAPLIQFNGTSQLYISDGTTNLASTNSMTAGVVAKAGSYWGAGGLGIATNGTPATAAFDGDMNAGTVINIGNNANSALYSWFGTIRNVRIGQRALSSSELQAVTA